MRMKMSDPKVIEKRAEQWARSNLIKGIPLKYEEAVEFGKVMYLDAHDLLNHKITSLQAQLSAYQEAIKGFEEDTKSLIKQNKVLKKELKACYVELGEDPEECELLEDEDA